MDITCTRLLEWDAAHRVMRHESKCRSLHGHRYRAEITCHAADLDSVGRVIDFGVIKEVIGKWIDDKWDHTTIVNVEDTQLVQFVIEQGLRAPYVMAGEPTAENMAKELLIQGQRLLQIHGSEVRIEKVRIYETINCFAEAHR